MTEDTPTLGKITRQNGVAGQYALTVPVTYPGESRYLITFVGSTYGGRVVMVAPNGRQTFVAREVMERCGEMLTPEWVQTFFADDDDER